MTRMRNISGMLIAALLAAAGVARAQIGALDVPYVPTPDAVVQTMLKMADVRPSDYVVDLGSGDGRIVIAAAKQFGARGFGVDLDGGLVHNARREAARQGVADRAEFFERNLFVTDIGRATVLTMYLFPRVMLGVRERIFAEMKPGSRVVSHEFEMGNWQPDRRVTVPVPDKPYGPPSSEVLLWIVPANAAGRWQWRFDNVEFDATLSQTFQMVEGRATAGGRAARITQAKLRGTDIGIEMMVETGGREVRHEFTGRVSGDAITGWVRVDGRAERSDWTAKRVAPGKFDITASLARDIM